MLRYTNGIGHFLMSIFMTLVGLVLILYPGISPATQGVGIGVILAVQAAWFVPGAAKQVAHEVSSQLPTPRAASSFHQEDSPHQQQLAFSNQDTMKMQAVKKV